MATWGTGNVSPPGHSHPDPGRDTQKQAPSIQYQRAKEGRSATCQRSGVRAVYLRGLQDEVVDDDLLLVGETQSVFTDEGYGEGLTVHGLLSTRPVHKLILRLEMEGCQSDERR